MTGVDNFTMLSAATFAACTLCCLAKNEYNISMYNVHTCINSSTSASTSCQNLVNIGPAVFELK